MAFAFYLAVLLGSYLVFAIQPMMAKTLLPYVGGAPAVWVASMLFFQLLLLAGYGYAALSSSYISARRQSQVHIALMALAIFLSLPISLQMLPNATQTAPEYWVITTLLASIGLPYLLLSANAALLQRWYYETKQKSPYFLFAISNAGSLAGLLSYPLLIEWIWPLQEQMLYWSFLFYGLVALVIVTALHLKKNEPLDENIGLGQSLPSPQILRIIFYGFVPSGSLFKHNPLYHD